MFPQLTDAEDLGAWTNLLMTTSMFIDVDELDQLLSVDPQMITVGEYQVMLDEAEAALLATDFSYLQSTVDTLEEQLPLLISEDDLPEGTTVQDVVDQYTSFMKDLIAGDTSAISEAFDGVEEMLEGYPPTASLADAMMGVGGFIEVPFVPGELAVGRITGDPHINTLDGEAYDFQAAGEFVALRADDGSGFEIQVRTVPLFGGSNVSVTSAVATQIDGAEVMIDATDATPLHVDGTPVTLEAGDTLEVGAGRVFFDGDTYRVVYPGEDGVVNDGDSQLVAHMRGERMDIEVRLDDARLDSLEGLLGDGDGDPDNDIARADGIPLARPLAHDDLYGTFRDDWRVSSEAESLFTYDAGESLDGFYLPDYPSETVDLSDLDPDLVAAAEDAALEAGLAAGSTAFFDAVLDFALTGDTSFLEGAKIVPVALEGTEADDVLTGAAGGDVLKAMAGNDRIEGGDGDDVLEGGDGDDGLLGQAGDDRILGGAGDDNIAASDGNDVVEGEAGNDLMGGGLGDDYMDGGADDDFMGGGLGNDTILGGDGRDVVNAGAGADELSGGEGADTMGASFGDDIVDGGAGDDSMGGGAGRDVLHGRAGDDSIGAGEGNDIVHGEDGDDFLAGGGRHDEIHGGAGADTINGGAGDDTMTGGADGDQFVFNELVDGETDVILGFEDGLDSFRMTGVQNAPGSGLAGYVDALEITDTTVEGEAGASMSYNGHTILVQGVGAAELTLDDFTFLL